MTLAELRDLFIIIFAIVGVGATVLLSVISFVLFRRLKEILDSGRSITGNVKNITSAISDDVVKPMASIAGVVQGIARVLEFFSDRKRGGSTGEQGE